MRVCVSVCLSVCLSVAACSNYCTDPDVTWRSGRGCPLLVHYWADLQSVHGLCCYGNITRTRNVSEYMLVLALCLVLSSSFNDTIHRCLMSARLSVTPAYIIKSPTYTTSAAVWPLSSCLSIHCCCRFYSATWTELVLLNILC